MIADTMEEDAYVNSGNNTLPKRVLIVGGGTSGWMAAALFAKDWGTRGVEISLMESTDIGTLGVGEGSTPRMRRFFKHLDIPESEWMPAANATYKCGIRFPGWSTRPGYHSYFHPFFTAADSEFARPFYHNVGLRNVKKLKVPAHPDPFFVSQHLAHSRRAPTALDAIDYASEYAYHFDSGLLGQYLKRKAKSWGVQHVIDTVTQVNRRENGDIASVDTKEHGAVAADLFVDCTGFAGVLIGKTMGVPFKSYLDSLFNDRAVALPTPLPGEGEGLPSETLSIAMKHGWTFTIPTSTRFGNGYIYSSAYLSEDAAEAELRELLGQHDASVTARHIKMRTGRRERNWVNNCLSVGLSQGFTEPLEATTLMLTQTSIEDFMALHDGTDPEHQRHAYNEKMVAITDGVRDYIFLHYKLNTRADTDYWRDCRNAEPCSDLVAEFLRVWDKGGDIIATLSAYSQRLVYTHTSWVCMLAGMGRFPSNPKKVKANTTIADPKVVGRHCEALVQHFPDHRAALAALYAKAD